MRIGLQPALPLWSVEASSGPAGTARTLPKSRRRRASACRTGSVRRLHGEGPEGVFPDAMQASYDPQTLRSTWQPLLHALSSTPAATWKRAEISDGIGIDFMGSFGRLLTQAVVIVPTATFAPPLDSSQMYRIFFSEISAIRSHTSNSSSNRNGL